MRARLAVLGVIAASIATASAAGPSLDVSPGLWEISTSGSASGVPQLPPAVVGKMTPEQRVMAEAMVAMIVSQANVPHVLHLCITAAQIRQGFDLNRVSHHGCHPAVQSSSKRQLDMTLACSGKEQIDGTVHLDAVDHTTLRGQLDLRAGIGANKLTIRQSLRGRWLGAACGDVRPIG